MTNNFNMSMSEFKGKVLESLANINKQIESNNQQHEVFFTRIRKLELKPSFSINPAGWLFSLLGFRR